MQQLQKLMLLILPRMKNMKQQSLLQKMPMIRLWQMQMNRLEMQTAPNLELIRNYNKLFSKMIMTQKLKLLKQHRLNMTKLLLIEKLLKLLQEPKKVRPL